MVNERKYITFNREVLLQRLGPMVMENLEELELPDVVVIRRQDKFASPCLLTYAAMINMVADNCETGRVKVELMNIADYFHEQGVLAGEEGWKLPTP